ncbi:hypothetical protein QTH34_03805 [Clostridium perfringens]|uniref:hypothetical protein n=1 Tax=Clostridium perfringens TaxID=1502 RepID=UPI0024BD3E92|nr:hypothetical protein [Clostridium perfringens]EJT6495329.1 hypothetical protein [Clostridium perfringens]MDK0652751.1 hypothetical protein [Clostridium perfringens]MDM0604378.1 hypothetical protein [Clostridium perfringens]MDU5775045.1 hypothetical protein [Clostridium perfringens]MDU6427774.1 hypothetical protein [Clostridium perfringens]
MKKINKKHIFKYLVYIGLGVISLLLVVLIINFIMVKGVPFEVAHNSDWIGFWGSLLGAILSGIITFIVLKVTIDNENKKRLQDRKLIEEQRLDDRRMSILPYLNYTIVDDSYIKQQKIEKSLEAPLIILPKSFEVGEIKTDCQFNLIVENLGLGVAVEPRIDKIYYDGIEDTQMARNNTILAIGDKAKMNFRLIFPKEGVGLLTLKFGYFNLLKDYYQQDIIIAFTEIPHITVNESKKIESTKMEYNPEVLEISKPKIIDDYKEKNIRVKIELGKS